MKENQELQILKEAVNMGINNLDFEGKEKVMHCFRTVQLQLQQFAQLNEENKKIIDENTNLTEEVKTLREDFKQVEGRPKKIITK